ncbi:Kinesin-like protein kif19 [Podochytrium sp. JEL0797]|nr:Kinesin-like protein kif19 [Podochytrium sp. JEL0797]
MAQSLCVTDFSDAQDVLRQDRPRDKIYDFDFVFSETATQAQVFEGTTKGLVDYVLQGFNTTVFAYGATGAGKTFTMLGTHESPGVMPQTLDHLFSQIAKSTRVQTTNGNASLPVQTFKVSLSYLEIYNENIRDLLSGKPDYLELWDDRLRGSVVAGIERVEAKTAEDVLDWLEKGNLNRTQEATEANEGSSRSHAVLQVFVARRTCNKKGQYTEQNGKLSMIDLAGSERAADTKNRGMRMIEGASINRSLLALGNCINALTEEGKDGKYVNYRDSKLTRLLKDSLGGNCKTVMIANISPTSANFDETLNTLKYASRARAIKNKSKSLTNVNSMMAELENCLLECFQERKGLQKTMNSVDFRIYASGEKIGALKRRNRRRSAGSRERSCAKVEKYEQKAIKLRALKKGNFRKMGELDDKVKSINQTFPRSLDPQSQKYLESRIKSHFIEIENLKLEGTQSILSSKLKRQESEHANFMIQMNLLETIVTIQRDMIDQRHIQVPDKLQEYYAHLKSSNGKPTSSGSDSSSSSGSSEVNFEKDGSGSSDCSSDESARQERAISRQVKSEAAAVKSNTLLFPRLIANPFHRQSSA